MKFKEHSDIVLGFVLGTLMSILIFGTIGKTESVDKKEIWKELSSQLIVSRTDIDILKGQMKIYENLPIDLRSRIEILEDRYENLIFFQREIDRKKKLKSPKNAGVVK